jgi:hypothetical protein
VARGPHMFLSGRIWACDASSKHVCFCQKKKGDAPIRPHAIRPLQKKKAWPPLSYFSHLLTPLTSLLAFIKSLHACKSFRRYYFLNHKTHFHFFTSYYLYWFYLQNKTYIDYIFILKKISGMWAPHLKILSNIVSMDLIVFGTLFSTIIFKRLVKWTCRLWDISF